MNRHPEIFRTLSIYIGLSVLIHLLVLFSMGRFGSYNFSAPIEMSRAVMVDMKTPSEVPAQPADSGYQKTQQAAKVVAEDSADQVDVPVQEEIISTPPPVLENNPVKQPEVSNKKEDILNQKIDSATKAKPVVQRHNKSIPALIPPLRSAGEFLKSKREKLTYLLSLLGVPVGSAELEAKNENGEILITLKNKSNTAFASIYPVDNFTETRHIGGNFIITKVKQHEGTIRRDIGYTIFLRDKSVFWVDLIKHRYSRETVPTSEVLDTLSSFYYLRKRPLKIGTTEILHVYDGNSFSDVTIEILRHEEIRLRNFKKVDTLLLRRMRNEGVGNKKAGELLIWLTNDNNKVPVKVEITNSIGKITAELVSSE